MGLYHTFEQYDCNSDGDFVFDPPPQKTKSYGCPTGKDTCRRRGKDPIHNFMDYSDDGCLEEFTRSQIKRMKAAWNAFRSS
jgi:Pregnancy-associated plasma protein-A